MRAYFVHISFRRGGVCRARNLDQVGPIVTILKAQRITPQRGNHPFPKTAFAKLRAATAIPRLRFFRAFARSSLEKSMRMTYGLFRPVP